jgi:sialidase-1
MARAVRGLTIMVAVASALAGAQAASADTRATSDAASVSANAVANTVIFQQKTGGYDCYRIPAVVKAGNGDLLAFAEARKGGATFCNDAGDISTVYKRSTDGGKTWGGVNVVIEGRGDTKGNPTAIAIPGTGKIVLLSTMQCVTNTACGRVPRVSYSNDNGLTWTAPRVLTQELGFVTAPGWLATGPSHGIVLTRGAHAGRLVAGMSYSISGKNTGAVIYSDDQGQTWHLGANDTWTTTTTNPQEISVVELNDGRVYAAARNTANNANQCVADGTRNRLFAISEDAGRTFAAPFAYEPDLITPAVQASTVRMSATDTGGAYNRLVFAGPSFCGNRRELVLRSSFDEGGNWQSKSDGVMVWDQGAAYSDLISLSATSIGVLYEAGSLTNANETIRWSTVTETALGAPACGSGYSVIASHPLGTAGTAYLSYDNATGTNCVSAMKSTSVGTPSATSAFLEVQGATRTTDSGNYSYFAGPVITAAANKCVKWGGSVGASGYTSEFEHCG